MHGEKITQNRFQNIPYFLFLNTPVFFRIYVGHFGNGFETFGVSR